MDDSVKRCSLCGGRFRGYGHNPEPLAEYFERCCDLCNDALVIPARLAGITFLREDES